MNAIKETFEKYPGEGEVVSPKQGVAVEFTSDVVLTSGQAVEFATS